MPQTVKCRSHMSQAGEDSVEGESRQILLPIQLEVILETGSPMGWGGIGKAEGALNSGVRGGVE